MVHGENEQKRCLMNEMMIKRQTILLN
jgi:hypothetical protein